MVTGHTGFIGGWLCLQLHALGARIRGFALPPPTHPSFHDWVRVGDLIDGTTGDIRSHEALASSFAEFGPEIIFHLAGQSLVRTGHDDPRSTFAVNVLGTVNVLEQVRLRGAQAVVVVTSDKVYALRQDGAAATEDDALEATDPYGASKVGAEIVTLSYARSYFAGDKIGVASIRAGNVIGGGDWANDRLIPDAIRAFRSRRPLVLRRPHAVRPWQHVLDVVCGMLSVAEAAVREAGPLGAWNLGPSPRPAIDVLTVARRLAAEWGDGAEIAADAAPAYPETTLLAIDSSRARRELSLCTPWPIEQAIAETARWYRDVLRGADARAISERQLADYHDARRRVAAAAQAT
jgi:CDP-glucose 4,6-dehydratase